MNQSINSIFVSISISINILDELLSLAPLHSLLNWLKGCYPRRHGSGCCSWWPDWARWSPELKFRRCSCSGTLVDSGNNNNLTTFAKAGYKPNGIDFPAWVTGGSVTVVRLWITGVSKYVSYIQVVVQYMACSSNSMTLVIWYKVCKSVGKWKTLVWIAVCQVSLLYCLRNNVLS